MKTFAALLGLEKITSAVRQTSVSLHKGGTVKGPLQTPYYDTAVMVRGYQDGPSIAPRETLVSRTAARLIGVVFPAKQTINVISMN